MKSLSDHLFDLHFIGSDDSNLLDDFTSVDDKLEASPVLGESEIAKEIRDLKQVKTNRSDDDSDVDVKIKWISFLKVRKPQLLFKPFNDFLSSPICLMLKRH